MFINLEGLVVNYLVNNKDYTIDEALSFWENLVSEIADALYGTSCMSVDEIVENNLGVSVERLKEMAE
jgi:hypothetical protein